MNIPEYNTELFNNIFTNLANFIPGNNESSPPTYDYLYDNTEHNTNYSGGPQHLETILQQLFSKMSDNQTIHNLPSGSNIAFSSSSSGAISPSSLSIVSSLPSSSNDANSYQLLSIISLWFVLIINPIVILFGVIGNLFAIYILINCNIAKLPVSFYTIMLNISDTLNLLIPVFIFWLDNCFNRTPERGYFRDKSNFLCKALMCPDQLFAALSAWYMCAISFNRWSSVCRPSSYYSRQSTHAPRNTTQTINNNNNNNMNENSYGHRKQSAGSIVLSSSSTIIPICFPFDCACCLMNNIKFRQHLQAFRSIGIITLLGILCCLYPIFMHELRPVISTNQHFFDLTQKITHTYAVVWKRCYYSRKHEYAYDIIGIILSCLLHVLPLTSVAAMNLMIIVRLRQRRLLAIGTATTSSTVIIHKKKVRFNSIRKHLSDRLNNTSHKDPNSIPTTHKDQSTSTDLPTKKQQSKVVVRVRTNTPKRHHARDRTITIMLVSVALSYLILTIPYRLFWSYNVYIKRMHPEKLNSSVYLLKMHYIDHVLRTIRNIHYGTNFVFFIFLSKTFRRKFQQLFIGKFLHASSRLFNRSKSNENNMKIKYYQDSPSKLEESCENHQHLIIIEKKQLSKKASFNETPSLIDDACIEEDGLHSILHLERNDKFQEL